MFDLIVYQQEQGQRPFEKWLESLRDRQARARIIKRMLQVQKGSLGDWKPVGEAILELRVDVGAGYRVYCGRHGVTLIVLLCGGDKSTQPQDIERAKGFWADWKRRHP